jgi:DNA (cytosine-5)-methyltransferase 1
VTVLSLFAGIGGFDIGLERAGFPTAAFCENDPFCQRVLRRHWPEVPIYGDIRELSGERLAADGIRPDILCGGFPCQDISIAGKGAGITGSRSGLWFEFQRLIGEIKPRFVLIENSPKLRSRGLETVLSGLVALGYDAEWHCVPATYVGAPHRRDRVWILAYPEGHTQRPYADRIRSHHKAMYVRRGPELFDEQECDAGSLAWRSADAPVQRVVDGAPSRLDVARLGCAGRSVVPQLVELWGKALAA